MRDPEGTVSFEGDYVIRRLTNSANSNHFLHSTLAEKWVRNGDLIPYEWIDTYTLRSPKLPFVTLPSEWTAQQFFTAAKLTLKLQAEAVREGWDLKDASAWNIVFDGLRPIFVDLLSFRNLQTRHWRAAGQLCRHFILPLLLARHKLLEPSQCMKLWRDGIPPSAARNFMGVSRFLTRYWPLMADVKSRMVEDSECYQSGRFLTLQSAPINIKSIQGFRSRLHSSLEWMLSGVTPPKEFSKATTWGRYEKHRDHYKEDALNFKRQIVLDWLNSIKPNWVLDVGCNAGEFSEIAVESGARVICWDSDGQALTTLFVRHAQGRNSVCYYPLLESVDDASGGRGWMGSEFPSLLQRLNQRVDVVMLLAITHHLAIAGGVPLVDIFRFAAAVTRKAVILELLDLKDERVRQLCQLHDRDPQEFTIEKQHKAAETAGFVVVRHAKRTPDDFREYLWIELRERSL